MYRRMTGKPGQGSGRLQPVLRLRELGRRTDLWAQRILITGANGFIGSHLCQRLLQEQAEVHAVYRTQRPLAEEAGRAGGRRICRTRPRCAGFFATSAPM